ncbi:MlaD family protein [Nocardia sp. BMG111209]|uniref:MlaD family protein n=1 Tax=Nocardia sp. BMG111209 TaxID=1160137 RepID=UPI0003AAA3DF|nr:MlaD family protein [Nocardia sp. BMG111209]
MPSVIARLRSRMSRGPVAGTADTHSSDLRWGIAGIGATVLLVIMIGVVYLAGNSGRREYSADLAQAGSIRTGDDVRIAGIPVGKVTSLTLLRDRVRMRFTVDNSVFLGDETSLAIRMLTVVGGYYLAAEPAGTNPLGATVIPLPRVVLPYNLAQAFRDAVQPIQQIDAAGLRRSLGALAGAAQQSPDALRSAVHAADGIVDILNKQNADVSRTLAFSDEYLSALQANSQVLGRLITKLGTLENIVETDKVQLERSLWDLATVLHDFAPLGRAWDASLRDRAQGLAGTIPDLQDLAGRLGTMLDSIRILEQRLLPFISANGVTVDRSATTIQAPNLCVPIPGGSC